MEVKICVGSSCHLRGSEQVVELLQKAVKDYNLEDKVMLMGSFCAEKCNRIGVTVQVGDEVVTGVTPESFDTFFKEKILTAIGKEA